MLTRCLAQLARQHLHDLGLDQPIDADLQFLKVSGAAGSSKVVFFGFTGQSNFPVFVAKLARSEGAAERIQRAHHLLRELHSRLPPAVCRALPRPLTLTRAGDELVALETHLPGQPMYRLYPTYPSRLQRAHIARDFRLALSWLITFHQATRAQRAPNARDFERCCLSPLQAFRKCHKSSPSELAALERAIGEVASPRASALPLVCQQGDYWPRNLLLLGERMGVCDWEWSRREELPFLDAFLFPVSYVLLLGAVRPGRRSTSDSLRSALLPGGWFARLCRDFIVGYAKGVGIDPALGMSLLHLALLHMAVRDYVATGELSRNDSQHRELLRICIEEELGARGWLADLGA